MLHNFAIIFLILLQHINSQGFNAKYPSFGQSSIYLDYDSYEGDVFSIVRNMNNRFDRGKYGKIFFNFFLTFFAITNIFQ